MMAEYENLPPSKIVERFGDEIRAAIQEVAEKTPQVATTAARNEAADKARGLAVRWYIASVAISLVIAFAVSWLMLNYATRSHATDVKYVRGVSSEVCSRDPNASNETHSVYICHSG